MVYIQYCLKLLPDADIAPGRHVYPKYTHMAEGQVKEAAYPGVCPAGDVDQGLCLWSLSAQPV